MWRVFVLGSIGAVFSVNCGLSAVARGCASASRAASGVSRGATRLSVARLSSARLSARAAQLRALRPLTSRAGKLPLNLQRAFQRLRRRGLAPAVVVAKRSTAPRLGRQAVDDLARGAAAGRSARRVGFKRGSARDLPLDNLVDLVDNDADR
ncbi:MAG: hypothetical protein H6707_03225 [Deltaproteobacteria bacterium]|nr:hypothetical protein [Deltaproteobacteria bacterium]